MAARYASDTIAGVPLGSSELSRAVAPDLDVRAGILLAPDSRALWARDAEGRHPMASITKVMTALLALEGGDLDAVVTISKAASEVDDATGLLPGETFSVRELLELALVTSSNDAAYALGEHAGGTMRDFVGLMNARAEALGLRDTHYVNAHGLDEPGHHSSATDIASLSRTAMALPEFRRIVAMESVTLPAYGKRTAKRLEATDELLGVYRGITGVKTGFTNDAKYCFASCAERDGITLTAVVLGAQSNRARFRQTTRLLNWGFSHMALRTLATTTMTVDAVPLSANPELSVIARFAETTSVAVFDLDGPVTMRPDLAEKIDLPVFAGQPLGEVAFVQGERELLRVAAVAASATASAAETVGAVPVSDYLDRTVPARAGTTTVDVREFDPARPVDRRVDLDSEVDAPFSAGEEVGEIVYSQDGSVIARVPVVAASSVAEPGFAERVAIWFARGWRMLTGRPSMARAVVLD